MTQLLASAGPMQLIFEDDKQIWPITFENDMKEMPTRSLERGFQNNWWPGSGLYGDFAVDVPIGPLGSFAEHELMDFAYSGAISRAIITGTARDAYGAPLSGALVKIFRTSDNSFIEQVIADSVGNFAASTPYYPDTHYLVLYKAGSPDVFGSTVNTLVGS
jgi:hypothetical protein